MFYKHWKKISLAITGFFWASCDTSSTTVEPPLYGAPPQYSSSSEIQNSSSSNEDKISSSSEPLPMPAYGVPQMDCEVTSENDSTVTCENGYTCTEKQTIVKDPYYDGGCVTDTIHGELTQVCLDYGIPYYPAKFYECNDGIVYDDSSFRKIYKKINDGLDSESQGN